MRRPWESGSAVTDMLTICNKNVDICGDNNRYSSSIGSSF